MINGIMIKSMKKIGKFLLELVTCWNQKDNCVYNVSYLYQRLEYVFLPFITLGNIPFYPIRKFPLYSNTKGESNNFIACGIYFVPTQQNNESCIRMLLFIWII